MSVRELLDYPVHEAAEQYLDQNRMHVFDMRFLKREVRELYEGDVRIVLDYLSDRKSLIQRKQKLRNPGEVLRMLYALSGDERYLENITFMEEGEGKSMCDLLDEAENRGIQGNTGEYREIQKGRKVGLIQGLISTCKELGVSFEETAAKLKEKNTLSRLFMSWGRVFFC